jgi:CheY-like chemotaxis protein
LRVREESSTGGVVLYRERRPAKDEPSPEEPNEPVVTGAAQEILLVEDNPSIATVLKKMLAKTGATCRWFPDGASALEALMAGHVKPDVLLCDIHMPEMDGVTFVRRARLLPELRDTPILMLTSDEALETEVRSLKSGADAFVGKSEDPKVLLGYVERMLLRSARRTAA